MHPRTVALLCAVMTLVALLCSSRPAAAARASSSSLLSSMVHVGGDEDKGDGKMDIGEHVEVIKSYTAASFDAGANEYWDMSGKYAQMRHRKGEYDVRRTGPISEQDVKGYGDDLTAFAAYAQDVYNRLVKEEREQAAKAAEKSKGKDKDEDEGTSAVKPPRAFQFQWEKYDDSKSPVYHIHDSLSLWKDMTPPERDNEAAYAYFRVMGYNTFMIQHFLFKQNKYRADKFGKYIKRVGDLDAICVTECFIEEDCNKIVKSLADVGYKHNTGVVTERSLRLASGVLIATPHEILEHKHMTYQGQHRLNVIKSPLNYAVNRGAVYAKIKKPNGDVANIVCSHPNYSKHKKGEQDDEEETTNVFELLKRKMDLTSGSDRESGFDFWSREARLDQLRQLRRQIERVWKLSRFEPIIVVGDFNVDKGRAGEATATTRVDVTPDLPLVKEYLEQFAAHGGGVHTVQYGSNLESVQRNLADTMRNLHVTPPATYVGSPYSLDPELNPLVHTPKAKYLDYVFVSQHGAPAEAYTQVTLPLRVDEEDGYDEPGIAKAAGRAWKKFKSLFGAKNEPSPKVYELSDHYPVVATIRFPRDALAGFKPEDPKNLPEPNFLYTEGFEQFKLVLENFNGPKYVGINTLHDLLAADDFDPLRPLPVIPTEMRVHNFWKKVIKYDPEKKAYVWKSNVDVRNLFHIISTKPTTRVVERERFAKLNGTETRESGNFANCPFKALTYNVMAPAGVQSIIAPDMASKERLGKIPKYLSKLGTADAACFTECYDRDACGDLRDGLMKYGYKHATELAKMKSSIREHSGVFIATPHEIVSSDHYYFKNQHTTTKSCLISPANCATFRGFVHAHLRDKFGNNFHVLCASFNIVGDHMGGAMYDSDAEKERVWQLRETRDYVKALNVGETPVVLLGDSNGDIRERRGATGLGLDEADKKVTLQALFREYNWVLPRMYLGLQDTVDVVENDLLHHLWTNEKPRYADLMACWYNRATGAENPYAFAPRLRADANDAYPLPGWGRAIIRAGKQLYNAMIDLFRLDGQAYKFEILKTTELSPVYPVLGEFSFPPSGPDSDEDRGIWKRRLKLQQATD